jgi:hypothetical protein
VTRGFLDRGELVRQLRQQGDVRGTVANEEALALNLENGHEAAIAEGRRVANHEPLALASNPDESFRNEPQESFDSAGSERREALPVRPTTDFVPRLSLIGS